MLFIKVIIIAALVKLLIETEKPFLCSGIYTVFVFGLAWAVSANLLAAVIAAGILFCLSSLYFWLLVRLMDGGAIWWLILFAGLAIGLL